jgi:hypothetical protein
VGFEVAARVSPSEARARLGLGLMMRVRMRATVRPRSGRGRGIERNEEVCSGSTIQDHAVFAIGDLVSPESNTVDDIRGDPVK